MIDNIDIQDTITLDDNKEYLVVGKTVYEEVDYLHLINVNDYSMKFAAVTGNQVIILNNETDKALITELTPLFLQSASKAYTELLNKSNNE